MDFQGEVHGIHRLFQCLLILSLRDQLDCCCSSIEFCDTSFQQIACLPENLIRGLSRVHFFNHKMQCKCSFQSQDDDDVYLHLIWSVIVCILFCSCAELFNPSLPFNECTLREWVLYVEWHYLDLLCPRDLSFCQILSVKETWHPRFPFVSSVFFSTVCSLEPSNTETDTQRICFSRDINACICFSRDFVSNERWGNQIEEWERFFEHISRDVYSREDTSLMISRIMRHPRLAESSSLYHNDHHHPTLSLICWWSGRNFVCLLPSESPSRLNVKQTWRERLSGHEMRLMSVTRKTLESWYATSPCFAIVFCLLFSIRMSSRYCLDYIEEG